MFAHFTDPIVLTGLGMVVAGGLLHASMLSLIANSHPAVPAEHRRQR
ncbi:hypothetical protein [Williamsia maris]|uniref:Uncharacterized protein n=1 Tax=Williamsia maris TaxID=72806 RepID=A0ABT1HJC1_9NOCA|nr:hypothetical protein [Williamsia maris]MCP2178041.1 hypothetical protein [Williamsia maris]